jgi:hypothetical protein
MEGLFRAAWDDFVVDLDGDARMAALVEAEGGFELHLIDQVAGLDLVFEEVNDLVGAFKVARAPHADTDGNHRRNLLDMTKLSLIITN